MNIDEVLVGASELLRPLRCGEGALTVLPSLAFCLGMGLLLYKLLRQGRPPLFRRITSDLLVQEVLFTWLINVTLKGWLFFLGSLDTMLVHYTRKMRLWFPPRWSFWSSGPDLSKLPFVVQEMLHPTNLKMLVCTFISLLPFMAIWKLHRDHDRFRNFMVWLGHNRWENNELGFGRYFFNRPAQVLDPPPAPARANAVHARHSTGSLLVAPCPDDRLARLRHRLPAQRYAALRASKSLH